MLKYFCFLLSIFYCLALKAQESDLPVRRVFSNEIGVNASYLINKVIDYQPDSARTSPYLLHYRFSYGKWGIKIGLGGRRSYTRSSEAGFDDNMTVLDYRLDASIGLDYKFDISKRLSCNFGLDYFKRDIVYDFIDDSGYDRIELLNQFHGNGFEITAGIRYWLNKHICIYTETMFGYLFGTTNNGRIFNNFPDLNDNILYQKSEDLITILPSSIFIIYRF